MIAFAALAGIAGHALALGILIHTLRHASTAHDATTA